MKRQAGFLIASIATMTLAGCLDTSNPITGGTTTEPDDGSTTALTVPEGLAGNLEAAVYSADDGTLKITLSGLDSPDVVARMVRRPALDIPQSNGAPGYQAYELQDTALDRRYLAYFAEGDYVMAGAVATEHALTSTFGGTIYDRSADFIQPVAGSAHYLGQYAGIINLTPNARTDRGTAVTGDAFVSVNFSDALIEGAITNRDFVDTVDGTGMIDGTAVLSDLSLHATDVTDGVFAGNVMIGEDAVGAYGGVLGGPNAEEVAATLVFAPLDDPLAVEYGTFTLAECDSAHASARCP